MIASLNAFSVSISWRHLGAVNVAASPDSKVRLAQAFPLAGLAIAVSYQLPARVIVSKVASMKMRVLNSERSAKRVAPLNNVIAKYLRMVCPGVYVHLDQTPDVITVGGTKTKPIGCSILSVTPVRPSTSTKGEHPHGICGFMPSIITLPHGGITPSISLRLLPHVRTWREWNVSLVQLSLSLTNPGTIPPPPP